MSNFMSNKVQLTILSVMAIALTAGSAFADFRPGRVRAGVVSDMRVTEATGIFERDTGARVELNYEDGKSKPVSFTLKRDGQQPVVLPISEIQTSACGDTYSAHTKDMISVGGMSLTLVDYSNIQCRMFVANKWHVTVGYDSGRGNPESHMNLEGQPEYMAVTLTTRR